MTQTTQINEQIRDKEVRLIGEHGELIGIISGADALMQAEKAGLDLVKISPNAVPPVCKIMDYGKFLFEQQKKLKEQKKKQKVTTIKEVQLTLVIQKNDIDVKAKRAIGFLEDGDKVKVVVKMKGRELANTAKALAQANSFYEILAEVGQVDKPAERLGRDVIMVIAPKKK